MTSRAAAALLIVVGSWSLAGGAHAGGQSPPMRLPAPVAASVIDARTHAAERELEAVLLQSLLAPMVPKERSGLFGTGAAGQHWRSMMTAEIARQMAASGRLPITSANGALRGRFPAASGGDKRIGLKAGKLLSEREQRHAQPGGWQTRVVPATPTDWRAATVGQGESR